MLEKKPRKRSMIIGEQLQENPYSSYTGELYPGSGHVVRHISKLFEAPPTKEIAGVR